jgi:hypothetical protein
MAFCCVLSLGLGIWSGPYVKCYLTSSECVSRCGKGRVSTLMQPGVPRLYRILAVSEQGDSIISQSLEDCFCGYSNGVGFIGEVAQ